LEDEDEEHKEGEEEDEEKEDMMKKFQDDESDDESAKPLPIESAALEDEQEEKADKEMVCDGVRTRAAVVV
jgi:hypothetical protein